MTYFSALSNVYFVLYSMFTCLHVDKVIFSAALELGKGMSFKMCLYSTQVNAASGRYCDTNHNEVIL